MAYLLRSFLTKATKRSLLTSAVSLSYTTADVNLTHFRHLSPTKGFAASTSFASYLPPSMAITRRDYATASSRYPSNDTLVLPGCDFEYWLVRVVEPYAEKKTRDEIIQNYVKILSTAIKCTEEEARGKMYSVSTRYYYGFGVILTDDDHVKGLLAMDEVLWVLPDSYLDIENNDYGGEPFINGEVLPYDHKYHETWVRITTGVCKEDAAEEKK